MIFNFNHNYETALMFKPFNSYLMRNRNGS